MMIRRLFALLASIVLSTAGFTVQAASIDPSVEITGVLPRQFCQSTDGQLLSQTGNTSAPASFRIQFFAPGFGEVYNVVLNFSSPGPLNFTGFSVSPFSLAAGTPFTIRTTTYTAPGGGGTVSFISELVFNCTNGQTISLVNTVPTVTGTGVPTLGHWGLLLLGALVGALGWHQRRRWT